MIPLPDEQLRSLVPRINKTLEFAKTADDYEVVLAGFIALLFIETEDWEGATDEDLDRAIAHAREIGVDIPDE